MIQIAIAHPFVHNLIPQAVTPRVAHALPFMYAPHEHGQHLCHRVLSVACSGFVTVADMKGNVAATRENALRIQVWPALIAILLPKWHTPMDGHR